MSLLLCAATRFEIQPIVDFIRRENIPGVEVLITGIGLTAATYSLTKAVAFQRPGFLLQAGIGGCLDASRELGSVVSVRKEFIGDLGVEEGGRFKSLFDLQLLDAGTPPWTGSALPNTAEALARAGLPVVDGVTVNEISTHPARIEACRQKGAVVESMEGAALHYVGLMEKIPFLQIRSLSNFAGERDKSKWAMRASIDHLNQELEHILLNLLHQ